MPIAAEVQPDSATLAANLAAVRARIAAATARSGRAPEAVRLVGVTKTVAAEVCAAAVRAGLTDLGENRVQEGSAKVAVLAALGLRPCWRLIGHLQRNKVATALDAFGPIDSVDSERLAQAISDQANGPRDVLLEVNIGGEERKAGFTPDELEVACARITALPSLRVRGLMTVAPLVADPEQARPFFRLLRRLADVLGLPERSMGMSNDFEIAIEEGATIVRVGRALFGERPAPGGSL